MRYPPSAPFLLFSLKNLETVKAVNLALRNFAALSNFSLGIYTQFGISDSHQSPDIGLTSDKGISDFWFSGQIPYK